MWIMSKTHEEIEAFVDEVVHVNAPRLKNPREWTHVWVDFWVSFFSMSYTLGHVAGVGIPLLILLSIVRAFV